MAKRYFADNDVEFVESDVSRDRDALRRMLVMTGQYGVPVIVVGGRAMLGWDQQEFHRMYGG